ncbi:aldo/keto reductase [Amycolatopsis benzoatilytica]|uniref:aldo/keto reductase n=1 Tax=Amycolatopsis benzoatilytica TaxID=346045 RepID=UPI00036A7CB2|nr:aldo/keto reductase [Amycolatopsis benzoatilytica]
MKYRTIGASPETRREVSALCLGAMTFGTMVDEATSFAVLDRFVESGGTFIDTADNYAWWAEGTQGGESEQLLGRWRKSRGIGDEVVIATKIGARPRVPGGGFSDPDGLSAKTIRESADRSRENLGVDRLDLLYAHIEDTATPLEETVAAFGELVSEGTVGLLGASNHWTWRVERARNLAAAAGIPGYEVLQYHHSYLRPRTDLPSRRAKDGNQGVASGEVLSYLRDQPGTALVAYSALLGGAYVREDRHLDPDFAHPGTDARLTALRTVATETGASANQVVLSWMIGHELPMFPLVGASSVAQLEDSLAGVALELSPAHRARLNAAR